MRFIKHAIIAMFCIINTDAALGPNLTELKRIGILHVPFENTGDTKELKERGSKLFYKTKSGQTYSINEEKAKALVDLSKKPANQGVPPVGIFSTDYKWYAQISVQRLMGDTENYLLNGVAIEVAKDTLLQNMAKEAQKK